LYFPVKYDLLWRMKITVVSGGLSPERDVSLSSGSLIANALMASGHSVAFLDVYEGVSLPSGGIDALFHVAGDGTRFSCTIPSTEPDLDAIRRRNGNRRELVGPNVLEACRSADVVFIALHGDMGENGQLQAFFDVYGIPYTGSGFAGCLLAMDKDVSKRLLVRDGIRTAEWVLLKLSEGGAPGADLRKFVLDQVGIPCVVKPCSCGSSVGVSMVESSGDLDRSLEEAGAWESSVIVEKKIVGREFSVGILAGRALPPIEIVPKKGFYDYKNKYQSGMTTEICPAPLDSAETATLQKLALAVHGCLRLGSYSRIDFIRDEAGDFWCLEANTLPGMTPVSLLPQEAAAVGISYETLCDTIARLPVKSC